MLAVAPLPGWPIGGVKFSRKRHYGRVLAVLGCTVACAAAQDDVIYLGSVFHNARDDEGVQLAVPNTCIVAAGTDVWAGQATNRHCHALDDDLVYPYLRIHPFPFTFSRPILIRTASGIVIRLYVSDVHLRWSEIARALREDDYCPSRYSSAGYPYNRDYFGLACSLFRPILVASPRSPDMLLHRILHITSGCIVLLSSYAEVAAHVTAFDAMHRARGLSVFTSWSVEDLVRGIEAVHGAWWIHIEHAVRAHRTAVANTASPNATSATDVGTRLRDVSLDSPRFVTY